MNDGNDQNEPGWVFKPGDQPDQDQAAPEAESPSPAQDSQGVIDTVSVDVNAPHVEWTASEYIAHQKTVGWFIVLGFATIILAAAVYFVTGGDIVSTIVIAIIGLMIGIFAARKPQVLTYAIDNSGLHIGQKFYPYSDFKSFSVVRDQAIGYISLMPLRRFMPPLIVHYDPEQEDKIATTLAEYLPYDDHKPDVLDTVTRKFRF